VALLAAVLRPDQAELSAEEGQEGKGFVDLAGDFSAVHREG
jgi:hypothetical protein